MLHRGEPDRLGGRLPSGARRGADAARDEQLLLRFFRQLGVRALKTIRPGHGSSLHYGGTFPIVPVGARPAHLRSDEPPRAPRAPVYLADGSIFPWLPPKGLTFNIMANADRVGTLLARR